jgi:hypothetical protein
MRATPSGPRCMKPNPTNGEPCMHTGPGGKHPNIEYHIDRFGHRWPNLDSGVARIAEILRQVQVETGEQAGGDRPLTDEGWLILLDKVADEAAARAVRLIQRSNLEAERG